MKRHQSKNFLGFIFLSSLLASSGRAALPNKIGTEAVLANLPAAVASRMMTTSDAQTSITHQSDLWVGVHAQDLHPKIGIPLAGYGSTDRRLPNFFDWQFRYPEASLFRPSEGYHSPIRAKTMVLKKNNRFLVFMSMDTIGVETRFIQDVARALSRHGIKESDIILAATHTHGGPGTLSKRFPLQLFAVDFYREENYRDVLNKTVQSVEAALDDLRPAELFKSKALINSVQKNKWRRKSEEHFDKRASFLIARDQKTKEWMGGLVNFSIHGGTMPVNVMLYSSDVNGAIERELEQHFEKRNSFQGRRPAFLFMNGAEGDVGGSVDRSIEAVTMLAKKFIQDAAPSLEDKTLAPVAPEFRSFKKNIFVAIPTMPLRKCNWKKAPAWLRLSVYPLFPKDSSISIAQVGDITYLTWPGEPSTQLGYNLQAEARKLGVRDPIVLGLTNDYMTYFTTKSEYEEGAYDSCSCYYGWKGGERIIQAHKSLISTVLR